MSTIEVSLKQIILASMPDLCKKINSAKKVTSKRDRTLDLRTVVLSCPGGLCPGGLQDRDPLDRDPPGQRPPWTETPLDRNPPRQRSPLDRDPPVNRMAHRCKKNYLAGGNNRQLIK